MSDLILAAKRGLYHRVLAELREGAPVNVRDDENATPLYWTACNGDAEICKLLLGKGADANLPVLWGSTPLHAAADRGHTECIKYLLRYGAKVNAQNKNGDTPLHLASFRGHKEACVSLVRQGADHTILNNHGKSSHQEAQLKDINKIFEKKSAHRASSYPLTLAGNRDVSVTRQRLHASDSDDSLLRIKKTSLRNFLAPSPEMQGEVRDMPGTRRIPNTMNQLSGSSSKPGQNHHRPFSAPSPSLHAGPLNIDEFSDLAKLNNVASDEVDFPRRQDGGTEHEHYIGTIDSLQLKLALLTSQKDALEMQLRDGGGSPSHELVQSELEEKLAKLTKELEKQSQERRESDARSHQLEMELMRLKQSCLTKTSSGDGSTAPGALDTTSVTNNLILDISRSGQKDKVTEGSLVRNVGLSLQKPYLCEDASLVHVFALMQEGKAAMQILRASTNKRLCLIRSSLNDKDGSVFDNPRMPWTLGTDYTVVNDNPVDRELKNCEDGLLPQISIKVLFQGQTYVMKIQMSTKKTQKPSTYHLSTDALGTEFSILKLLGGFPHPHITKICHHFEIPTSEVHSIVDVSTFLDGAISSQLADRTAVVIFPDHYTTLDNVVSSCQGDQASPHRSTQTWNERLLLRLLLQVLKALSHLQSHGIAHRDLHSKAMLVDWNLRLVLGEFGFARRLRNDEGQGIPFVEQSQIGAGNSLAWSPELLQFLRNGPPKSWQKVLTLVDVYESSDMYSAAATLCHLFGEQENPSSPGLTAKSIPVVSSRLPGFLSQEGQVLFKYLLKENPAERPTLQEAALRTGMLLYGPRRSSVDSAQDVDSWLLAQDIRMLATPPQLNTRELDEQARCLDWELCHDYIHSVPTTDLWQLCNNPLMD